MKQEYARWGQFIAELRTYSEGRYTSEKESEKLREILDYAVKNGCTDESMDKHATEIILNAKLKRNGLATPDREHPGD